MHLDSDMFIQITPSLENKAEYILYNLGTAQIILVHSLNTNHISVSKTVISTAANRKKLGQPSS